MVAYKKNQSGIVLIIGLIMLLLLTIIAITAMRVTSLEERMAGNLQNNIIAFQAAESALREAERLINSDTPGTAFNPMRLSNGPFQNAVAPYCVAGLCGPGPTPPLPTGHLASLAAENKITALTNLTTISREPEYMIELIRIDPSSDSGKVYATFRITARAWGGDTGSLVQLQSTYRLHSRSFVH